MCVYSRTSCFTLNPAFSSCCWRTVAASGSSARLAQVARRRALPFVQDLAGLVVSSFTWAAGIHSAMSTPCRASARAVPSPIQVTSMPDALALPPQ